MYIYIHVFTYLNIYVHMYICIHICNIHTLTYIFFTHTHICRANGCISSFSKSKTTDSSQKPVECSRASLAGSLQCTSTRRTRISRKCATACFQRYCGTDTLVNKLNGAKITEWVAGS